MGLFPEQIKTFIKDLKVGDKIGSYFKVLEVSKRTKRDGGLFLSLELMDKTGKMAAKIWDNAEKLYAIIKPGGIHHIRGSVSEYKKKLEIKIDSITVAGGDKKGYNPEDFIEQPPFNTEAEFEQMASLLKENVQDKYLLQLLDLFIKQYKDRFRLHYGAQRIHHAHAGGLLQHTHALIRLAILVADFYSLNKELLMTGALFHDLGKIKEFQIDPSVSTTAGGGLVGHLVMGNTMFLNLKEQVPGFPDELSVQIQHLILAHHGHKEFGSPEVPKTKEAFALYIIDLLDSKMNIFDEVITNSDGKDLFSEYHRALERRLYIPPAEGDD